MSVVSAKGSIRRQPVEARQGGWTALVKKTKRILPRLCKLPLFILAVPAVLGIRLIRPWLLVRVGNMVSPRIGHFAGNTELYLCERDAGINVPAQRHVDLFFMGLPISNKQLARMWKRVLRVGPAWILIPVGRVNRLIPGGAVHDVGHNAQHDRDINNLLDRFPPHLKFISEEQVWGETGLRAMGIPAGAPFVCLIVRDSAYLDAHMPTVAWDYHSYRDSNIQNYVMAAEELADRGYFVIRMGAKVRETLKSSHPKVIDYATNGMRSDFMDVYLGAKCDFCISTGAGYDAVPLVFRRPIVFVNSLPLGYLFTFRAQFICITRHHVAEKDGRELTLGEIFSRGVGFCLDASGYEKQHVRPMENSPGEIRDVVVEMAERLNGTWRAHDDDETLQKRFWEIFLVDATRNGKPLHGEIRSRYGAAFLRNNRWWLDPPTRVASDTIAAKVH